MNFTESLLKDIRRIKKEGDVVDKLKARSRIGIWGTGLGGRMVCEVLREVDIEVQFFLDNDRNKIGTEIQGILVKGIDEIPSDSLVIIAANVKYKIHEQLKAISIEYMYIDPIWLHSCGNINVYKIIEKNGQQIDSVYNMLKDDISKRVYRNILLHRAVHSIELIWEVYSEHQYFANDLVQQVRGCFVDCGAFQGDTLKKFLQYSDGSTYRYFAFEADYCNYDVLKNYCTEKSLKNVYPLNLCVWNRKERLYFNCTGDMSGKVIGDKKEQDVVEMMANSIDNVLFQENIDFIKMDIEGAEINALDGAKKSIMKSKPILAISAYHKLEHLWKIPILIREINQEYQIYFRQHACNMADTVCYAILGERKM